MLKYFLIILILLEIRKALVQNVQCPAEIADVLFHKIYVIASAYQLQMGDAGFLQLVKST